MPNDKIRETLAFEDLTPEEKSKRKILGRLYGPVADVVNPTRNGRKYSEQLWEKVFKNPIMQEKFKNKVMYGELGHPEGRTEIDMTKAAICMPEPPKEDKDGRLIAYFDILDTPCGRILKTLCDYGSTLGISSRGTGDVGYDDDGEEAVDPDTYDCECWDIVLVPAVESARLSFTEGLGAKPSLRQALSESLSKASKDDQKAIEESLQSLNLNVGDAKTGPSPERGSDTLNESGAAKACEPVAEKAADCGSDAIVASLKEALKAKSELEAKVRSLQERLAVSDAEANRLNEELGRNKSALVRLSTLAHNSKGLPERVSKLEEELESRDKTISALRGEKARLNESVASGSSVAASKDARIKELGESLASLKKDYESRLGSLGESLSKANAESERAKGELTGKAEKSQRLAEGYRKLMNEAVDRLISSKALALGISEKEIRGKLGDRYTFDDIDKVCESLGAYELNISKLPFSVDRQVKFKVSGQSEAVGPAASFDDDVDETTLKMAGLGK